MAEKKTLNVEISDVIEEEQEDAVIRALGDLVEEGEEELRRYFASTDTYLVKRVSPERARQLAQELEQMDVVVRVFDSRERAKQEEGRRVRCPRCGHLLEFSDWRCPECYYEFTDYQFRDDLDEEPAESREADEDETEGQSGESRGTGK